AFAWFASCRAGDQTTVRCEMARNDPTDSTSWVPLPGNVKLVTLVVPRDRSNGLSGVQEVAADIWSGTYATTRILIGTIQHLKLDTLNKFYVRARDIAGDVSPPTALPG